MSKPPQDDPSAPSGQHAQSRHVATKIGVSVDGPTVQMDGPTAHMESQPATLPAGTSGSEAELAASANTVLGNAAELVAPGPVVVASSPGHHRDFAAGHMVNQYEIIRELGRGGMGKVVLARDTVLGRRVALKFLISSSAQFNKRFLIEARTTAQVSHENIVIIHEANEYEGAPYMVLEFLEGQTLADYTSGRNINAGRVVELMVPVVRALARAHQFNIVHRDLKPDNIFITDSGQVKVLDFGIAKLYTDDNAAAAVARAKLPDTDLSSMSDLRLTAEGAILGTMPYMAPEQWGHGEIDHASDVWALGIMLFELLAGRHPLEPLSPQMLQLAAGSPDERMPSLGDCVPDLPSELINIVDRCLQKKASARFADASEVLEVLEPLLPERHGRQLSQGENPFPGLVAFQESDAGRFFGRSRDIVRAAKKLREQPLLGIVGASGVGKSSLIRAGLVPKLKASGEDWECFTIRPGRDPLASLVNLLQPLTGTSSSTVENTIEEHARLIKKIREQPGYVGTLLRNRARQHEQQLLLFVDQFEELYTLVTSEADRAAFTSALVAIADDASSPLRVVVSMRSDFLDRVGEDEIFLEELSHGLLFLQRPDREGLREALTAPIELAGYEYEMSSLVKDMLDSLADTPGALPLLQFAAARLWEDRDRSRRLLTADSYAKMGGVAGTLATHANEVIEGLGSSQQRLVRNIFQRLVTPDRTRAIVDVSELQQLGGDAGEIEKLIAYLVKSRLLVTQSRGEGEGAAVEIVHESLISKWPRLRRWLDEGHEDALFLDQLRAASKQWEQKGRPDGLLWRGEAMVEARRFQKRFKGDLAEREASFLSAVIDLEARAGRTKRRLVMGSFALLVFLVIAGSIALVSIRDAKKEAIEQADVAEQQRAKSQEAEAIVRQQYELLKEKEQAKAAAEKETAEGRQQIRMTNAELQVALSQAEQARALAESENAKAQKAASELKAAARALELTADKERAAKLELAKLNRQNEAELAKLRAKGQKIKKTLD